MIIQSWTAHLVPTRIYDLGKRIRFCPAAPNGPVTVTFSPQILWEADQDPSVFPRIR
jgi:hypothetical protein